MKQVTNFCTNSSRITCARRGGLEVAGSTVDQEIRLTLTTCGISDGKEVKDIFG